MKLSLALVFLHGAPGAQETRKDAAGSNLKTHNIGFGAGFLTGYGLTYRHWFPSKHGYQFTFIPVVRIDDEETYFNASLGAIGMRSLHQAGRTNFFGYYGGHYNLTYQDDTRLTFQPGGPRQTYQYEEVVHNVYAGAGLGIEIHFWNLNYSLMFGYAANGRTERVVDPALDSSGQPVNPKSGEWRNSFQFRSLHSLPPL